MFFFLVTHLLDDSPAFCIFLGQSVQMTVEVGTHLLLGLGNKAQAPFVTECTTRRADHECARVPQRAQETRTFVEFLQALFTPGEVVEFFIGGALNLRFDIRVAGDDGVALVQGLGGDFAGMVDPHQTGRMRALLVREFGFVEIRRRIPARRLSGRGRNGAKCIVGPGEQPVERREVTFLHARNYTNSLPACTGAILRGRLDNWSFRMEFRSVLLVGLLVFAAPLFAQEEEVGEESPWSGNVKLGYLATSGNTESESMNSSFEVNYVPGDWEHQLAGAAIYSTESSVTTAEAYDAGWKSARNFGEANFIFGRLDWRKDRFGSITEQFSQTIGYGRRLVDREKHQLNGELGAGARQSDLADGTDESDTIYTGRLTYTWTLSETASFGQSVLVESGSGNTFTESVTDLRARLVGGLALVASYTVRQNSDVLPGTEKTDTRTAISLEYAF